MYTRLLCVAVIILYSTVAEAPRQIKSITEWKIMEELDKMEIEKYEAIRNIYKKMHDYLISEGVKEVRIRHQIVDAVYKYSIEFNLSRALILAMIYEESDPKWDPDCISPKGARGLMQIMPVWDKPLVKKGIIESPEQIFDIEKNIMAGCWILKGYKLRKTQDTTHEYLMNIALDNYSGGGGQEYIDKVRKTMARIEEFMNATNSM